MPQGEASVAASTSALRSSTSVDSVVFGSVDSPPCSLMPSSPPIPAFQLSLHQHGQPLSGTVTTMPGRTSAGPPVLIPDVSAEESFTVPSAFTFHSGCDTKLKINSNSRRSRFGTATKRRKPTGTPRLGMCIAGMPSIGHSIPNQCPEHMNNSPGQSNIDPNNRHDLDAKQQQTRRLLVSPLAGVNTTGVNTADLTTDMDTNY